MPTFSRAFFKDMKTPLIFCKVPLIPVVGPIPLARNVKSVPSIFARATSVVALPISTPATYFISPILSSTQIIWLAGYIYQAVFVISHCAFVKLHNIMYKLYHWQKNGSNTTITNFLILLCKIYNNL